MSDFGDQFACVDCHVCTGSIDEYYMVHDHVWLASGMSKRSGMLCLGCLESRLQRRLTPEDFKPGIPINMGIFPRSPRMLDRLGVVHFG